MTFKERLARKLWCNFRKQHRAAKALFPEVMAGMGLTDGSWKEQHPAVRSFYLEKVNRLSEAN